MVQCLNEFPRIKDKSDSLYRRQLFIPFDKCFTGHERKYIKNDYLHRDEVLEYVMYKVLHMNFYTLSEPSACKNALQEYKEFNDPIRQFAEEMFPEFTWDLLPFSFLYDLYKSWFRKNSPNGSIQGKNTFIASLINLLPQYPNWYCKGRNVAIRPGHKMDNPELLIMDYDLKDWESKSYNGGDPNKRCIPSLKYTYNGLLRRVADDVDDEADGVELRVV
jgi:putative DNA primase/helicase